MEELLELLKDGKTRTLEQLCEELDLSVSDLNRSLEFLEMNGFIRRVEKGSCCGHCSSHEKSCSGCMPEGGFKNMGTMWEVLK